MLAFEIQRNGRGLVVAGDMGMDALHFAMSVSVDDVCPARLELVGYKKLTQERTARFDWLQEFPVNLGDEIRLTLVEADEATSPLEEITSDSEEQVAAQARYEAQLAMGAPEPIELERRQPNATLEVDWGNRRTVATFEGGRELMTLNALWVSHRPRQCRLSMRTFSIKEGLAQQGGLNWLKASLVTGEAVIVRAGLSQS